MEREGFARIVHRVSAEMRQCAGRDGLVFVGRALQLSLRFSTLFVAAESVNFRHS
jgi:hypothetical protein